MKSSLIGSLLLLATSAFAAVEEGFHDLFNGRDLTGWVNVNCSPETWSVKDGMVHCTGVPTGALRTERQFENFILELEWRHLQSGGNSGVFIWGTPIAAPGVPFLRGIEVQVLDHGYAAEFERKNGKKSASFTTHGDVFPIHGATMKPFGRHNGMRSFPSEERSKGSPEWNHYRIVCNDGVIRLSVNDKEVSGGEDCNYRKGYLALESEGAPVDFRNIRIKELPSTGATPELTAPVAEGHRALYNGVDLRGWKTPADSADRWQPKNWQLVLKPGPVAGGPLWTDAEFGDCELILDCRVPKAAAAAEHGAQPAVLLRGPVDPQATIPLAISEPGKGQRFVIRVKGRAVTMQSGNTGGKTLLSESGPARGPIGLQAPGGVEFANLFVREL